MMKVELNGAYRAYQKNSMPISQQGDRPGAERTLVGQQDRISISSQAAQKSELDRLVYSTAAEVEAGASASRLSELRQAVASGQYHVPAQRLADAILDAYI